MLMTRMDITLLSLLLAAALTGAAHECERPCVAGDVRTCMYEFHVQEYHTLSRACFDCPENLADCMREECIPGDGVARPLLTVNRQLPGPFLQVCEGDRMVVDLHNHQLSDTETLHWHGQHMKGSQYYDGVPYVTQCPVMGGVFRYDFPATTAGTHLWHSHSGLHRGSGVFGAMVVRQAEDPHRALYDTDLTEHVIVVNGWNDMTMASVFATTHHTTTKAVLPSTILINGKGRYGVRKDSEGQSTLPQEVVHVTSGMRHRLRFVHGGSLPCPMIVSVDSHRLTIIAMDGDPVIPFTADSFVLYSGERFDVVLEANQAVDNYWIRLNGLSICQARKCVQGAVLRYDGAPQEEPDEQLVYSYVPPGVVVNQLFHGEGDPKVDVVDLSALVPSVLKEEPDRKFYLGFDFKHVNNTNFFNPELYPYNQVDSKWKSSTPQVNGISFVYPASPPLSQPDTPQPTVCVYGQDPPCESDFCSCTYIVEVALGETVEFVLIDEGTFGDGSHPFHLHGYNFHVIAMERLGNKTTVAEVAALDAAGGITRKLQDTVRKDTVNIPDGGYTVIRFTADNPGWWAMHCHLVDHSEMGMVGALHVGTPGDLPPVPKGFPTCGTFLPSLQT